MDAALLIALIVGDPYPYLPSERVCILRYNAANAVYCEAHTRTEALANRALWDFGGTYTHINRERIAPLLAQARWEEDEAEALKDFFWSCWWVRWSDKRCTWKDRIEHAERCRTYLGLVVDRSRWWEK
jgi:hypothetical protein